MDDNCVLEFLSSYYLLVQWTLHETAVTMHLWQLVFTNKVTFGSWILAFGLWLFHPLLRGGSRGHGGPMPTLLLLVISILGLPWAYSARSYSDAAHISTWITASCPANTEHSNLQIVFVQCSASNTKADSEGKGLRETTIQWVTLQSA